VLVRSPTLPGRFASRLSRSARGHLQQKACGSFVICLVSTVAPVLTSACAGSSNRGAVKLILDGLVSSAVALAGSAERVHALSSFQRTKAPVSRPRQPRNPMLQPSGAPVHLRFCFGDALQGNLTSLRRQPCRCQPLPRPTSRLETASSVEPGKAEVAARAVSGSSGDAFDRRHRVKRIY
jgi:hypothetical protein